MSAFEDGVKAERDRCIAVVDEAQTVALTPHRDARGRHAWESLSDQR